MPDIELDPLRPLHGQARRVEPGEALEHAAARLSAGDFLVLADDGAPAAALNAALASLRGAGCGGIIAPALSEPFVHAAINGSLPALIVEEAAAIRDGDRLRVDVEGHKIANLDSGDRYVIRNIHEVELDVLRAGGLTAFRGVMDEIKRRHGM